jgi:hypothetical protein
MNDFMGSEPITEGNREEAINALCMSASIFERAIVALLHEAPKESVDTFMKNHADALYGLSVASQVTAEWRDFLEIRL